MTTTLSCTINSVSCPVAIPATIKKRVSLRSTADIVIIDLTGTLSLAENMQCTLSDSSLGTLFTGYVDKIGQTKAAGSSATLFRQVTLKDLRWLADKRLFTSTDYKTARLAGDILCDLHTQYLSAEGLVSAFAQRYDKDSSTWGAGTLTNVSGSSGALQLASAGSTVTITEATTANFNAGTLTSVTGSNNRLILAPFSALKLTGYSAQGQGASNNNYYYIELWNGSASIGVIGSTNPSLRYQIWISSTSPAIVGGVDFICSDGTTLRSQGLSDHLGIQAHPGTDLSGYANDQWYSRTIDLNSLTGKTINTVTMALEGDPAGTYTIYCATIALYDGNGALQTTFFNGTMNSNMPYSNVGYSSVSFSVANVYPASGNRVSSNYSLTSAGIARTSLVTWQAIMLNADGTTTTLADNAQGANQTPYVKIEVSLDGGTTYQQVTNHTALSALMAGVNLSAQTLTFRETLTIAGTSPEVTPALSSITASVFPSYQATKTDVRQSYTSTWATGGTLSLTQAASDGSLQLQGAWRNWNDGGIGSQVVWGTGTPSQKVIAGQFLVNNTGPSTDVRSQFTFAGTWGPNLSGASTGFTMDVDFYINSFGNYGMVYGTTNWNNANNTFAYEVDCTTSTLTLGRGSNAGSSGTFTNIATASLPLTAGEWHHMTVIWFFAGGGNYQHLVYIDDVNYINVIDNTFTAHGYFGSRFFNNTSANHSAFVDNFGVVAATSGTWISNAINLSSVGTAGNSLIMWNQSTPTGTSVLVEVSLNNGSTYTTCTNNTVIPGITSGTNVSTITQMRLRITLTTSSASYTPSISGLTVWVMGQYSASGNRIAPVLAIGGVGTAGSTSVVWNATTPTNTSVLVDTSPDNVTYTNIAASGNAIPNITTQPDPTIDDFLTNTSANYTQSSGTWTWDTTNQRLVGTVGVGKMVYTSITATNCQVQSIMDYADAAGLVARWTNNSNTYVLVLNDASAASSPNTATLSKVVTGTTTVLGSSAISFTRGTYHTPTLSCVGTTISVQFDGTTIISVTDSALSSGKMGFHVGTKGQWYTLWLSPLGQSLTGQNIYSRVRLTSTDPTATPSVQDLTVSVRSPEIDNGASIPNTSWSYSSTLGAAIDDLAKKSNAWWGLTNAKHVTFQTRLSQLASWPLASANGTDLMGYVDPQVSYNSPSYRNRQYVLGATTTQVISENKIGDGSTQSWALGYPVSPNTTPTITVGLAPQVVGLQGATGTFDFTFTPGSSGGSSGTIIQSATATPPAPNVVIAVSYSAITPVTVQSNSVSQQTLLAGYDGSTGIVEAVETVSGLTQTAAQQLADARITQYANLISTWQFTTRRDGLAPGQILYVFVPELKLTKVAFLITEVDITLQEEVGVVKAVYNVSASLGPPTSQWTRLFITPS